MKVSNYIRSTAAKAGSIAALSAAMLVGAAVPSAQAQGRYYGNGNDRGYTQGRALSVSDVQRLGVVNGYAEGYEAGARDRRDRARASYQNDDAYRRATSGYENDWNAPRQYQASFRQGFKSGYLDGYNSRARNRGYERPRVYDYRGSNVDPYSNYPSYRSSSNAGYSPYYGNESGDLSQNEVAQRAAYQGYYDGFYRGQSDMNRGVRQGNPQGHGAYQNAFNGWSQDWGWASTYQQSYRQYFVQGYQDGFGRRSYAHSRNRRWW